MCLASVFSLKREGWGDKPSKDPQKLLSLEVIRVKAIWDKMGQVPALSREPKLKGIRPRVSLETAVLTTHPYPKADELPAQP